MKTLVSTLATLAVLAAVAAAPASATFVGSKNADQIFKKIERNLP